MIITKHRVTTDPSHDQPTQDQAQKFEEHGKEMREQTGQLAHTLREQLQQQCEEQKEGLETKLQQHFQEAIKQLSDVIISFHINVRNKNCRPLLSKCN